MADVHGVRVSEVPQVSAPPIPLPDISAGAIIGTAPDLYVGEGTEEDPWGKFTKEDPEVEPAQIVAGIDVNGAVTTSSTPLVGGSGYADHVNLMVTGGGGTGAELSATVMNGVITAVTVDDGGSGYVSAPEVTVETSRIAGYGETYLVLRRGDASGAELGNIGTLPLALDAIFAQQGSGRLIIQPIERFENGPAILDVTVGTWEATYDITSVPGGDALHTNSDDPDEVTYFQFPAALGSVTITEVQLNAIKKGQVITVGSTSGGSEHGIFIVTEEFDAAMDARLLRVESEAGQSSLTDFSAAVVYFSVGSQDGIAKTRQIATGNEGERIGVYAFLSGRSLHGFAPRLISAAGLDTGSRPSDAKNPLAAAMETVAERVRGIALVDGPNTTHADAIMYADDFGSDRVVLIDPHVKTSRNGLVVNFASSAFLLGLILKTDSAVEGGWADTPSNKLFNNVLGTARPIDFVMGDPNTHGQLLDTAGIGTIVNLGGGYRFLGDYTQASGARITWKFLNVRRIADAVYDALADNHLWAVDKRITRNYLSTVADGVNGFLTDLSALEVILGGTCYPDPDLNTERNLALGIVNFVVEFTPVYPARTINFKIELNTRRLADLVA